MNMVVETAVNGVSDSDYTVRHADKRCTASTYSARSEQSEAEYWMLQHDAYSRRAGRCLVTAAILLCAALSCMVAMAAAPAIAMVLMGLALAGRGWWCRRPRTRGRRPACRTGCAAGRGRAERIPSIRR